MTAVEPHDEEFVALLRKITLDRGFHCASYKESCVRRRVAVRMRARGVHRFADYAHLLDSDAREYDLLLDALTINVSKLFRNPEVFSAIARDVIPVLWDTESPRLRVWSVGCSSGHEPYSLAALFHAHAERVHGLHRLARVDILGTDIDQRSLTAAARGEFSEQDFSETAPELRARYFSARAPFTVVDEIRRLVRFARHDMLREAPPRSVNELIVCRNAIIYFDKASQERLMRTFHDALVPGGFLVLGKVETLFGTARALFTTVAGRERIYRRPA
jgi:chemotaxis protein methyltransferase CheR